MKIVITGATGYIGRHMIVPLSKNNEVYAIVRKTSDTSMIEDIVERVLVYDSNVIYEELKNIKPNVLIHLAGVFYGEHTEENIKNLLESNLVFSTVIFDAVTKAGAKSIINTGTYWQQYAKEKYNPVNLYAATKQAAEDILLYYVRAKGCKAITLQIFDTYGPEDNRNKILNIIARLEDGDKIDMSGGEQKLYYCYVDDLVNGYIHAIKVLDEMQFGEYKRYALRSKEPVRLKEIVREYLEIHPKNVEINWGGLNYREREIMDPSEIGEVLPGWKPKYDLHTGLARI